jgi:DNA-binding MarR family transcriptional regulator
MSEREHFEGLYMRLWRALHRGDDPDLSQHELQVLHHVPADRPVTLSDLAGHLGIPRSTCSEMVKSLAGRGFIHRRRDPSDDRRVQLSLTSAGAERVGSDTVLEPAGLARALAGLESGERQSLLRLLEKLAASAEAAGVSRQRPKEVRTR